MYDFYSESRKLERIFKALKLKPQCHDLNLERPRISDLVQKFSDAVEALGSEVGADAIPGHDDSRYLTAAVAILRTELAFYAVKCIQLCKRERFQPHAVVSDDNMEGTLTGVAPSVCIQATLVLRALTEIAVGIEHTRIPLLKQVIKADIHTALSEVASAVQPVALQPHHPATLEAYESDLLLIQEVACSVYQIVRFCTRSDMSASSRQLLSRFWVGSVQHKTPMAIMDLVSARRLSDAMETALQLGFIITAHTIPTAAGNYRLPECSKALEALCRSHTVQQFSVQMLQGLLSSDQYSGYEETHVLSDSLVSSERGVLVESLRQFAAGKLGSKWGWSTDLTCCITELFWQAWDGCSFAGKECSLEVLVSVVRQAGALLALRRLPLEQQKRGVRQARAAGILQGMTQLEPSVSATGCNDTNTLVIIGSRGLQFFLAHTSASGCNIEISILNISMGEICAAFEGFLRNAQDRFITLAQKTVFGMYSYLSKNTGQLQRPSDCALGFLTSLQKVLASDLVDQGNSIMHLVQHILWMMITRTVFADSSPAPGPGVLSALLLQFLPLFTRCIADFNCSCSPMITWRIVQSIFGDDREACCEAAAACNAAEVLKVLMRNPVDTRELLTRPHVSNDGSREHIVYQHFTTADSNPFMLGVLEAWDYQVLMVADPLSRLLEQVPSELRPRALLVAVCGVEFLTSATASLELPSKIALHEEAVRLVAWLAVCGNDTADEYPQVIHHDLSETCQKSQSTVRWPYYLPNVLDEVAIHVVTNSLRRVNQFGHKICILSQYMEPRYNANKLVEGLRHPRYLHRYNGSIMYKHLI